MARSNIESLLAHMKELHKNVLRSQAMKEGAKSAGAAMKGSVIKGLSSAGYDYRQSGTLLRVIKGDVADMQVNKTGTSLKIGFGDIDELNYETKRGPQRGIFSKKDGSTQSIGLRPEPSLPSWIIMEFGRKAGNGVGMKGIPKAFQVSYTPRDPNKQFMFGPSKSMHFNKRILFMTERQGDGVPRTHPGIRAGRFFRDGLKNAKDDIDAHLSHALREAFREVAGKNGWRVF